MYVSQITIHQSPSLQNIYIFFIPCQYKTLNFLLKTSFCTVKNIILYIIYLTIYKLLKVKEIKKI